MATPVNVNGKIVTRPGVYTLVKSGIQNSPVRLDSGIICIVDTGIGASWGGGKGSLAYDFDSIQDFRNFVKGGPLWDIALPLWKPVPSQNLQGVSKIILIQARETTPATITLTGTNFSAVLTSLDEGLNANGSAQGITNTLKTGYGITFKAGKTADKYIYSIWHGSYKGLDPLNLTPYEGVELINAKPVLIAQSPEVGTAAELKAWLEKDPSVKTGFTVAVTITSTGDIVPGDVNANYILATGATEDYSSAAFTAAINKAKEANCTFFLSTDFEAEATSANNDALFTEVILTGKYDRFLHIAGYTTAAELDDSILVAKHFDSDHVNVVHGDGLTEIRNSQYKKRSTFWKAADILGRLCGLDSQTPLTLKKTGIDKEANPLDEVQQEKALKAGVIVTYQDEELGYNVVLQGVNTLQNNENLVNDDGSSHSIAVKRITAQLNKEVAIYLKRKFFGNDTVGPNRNTVTEEDLIAATEGYLQKRTASSNQDDLIIRFQNITATVNQDTYYVNYEFVPNYEVNKFIITGIILDK